VPKIPLQFMNFLHITLDSKSGLQMSTNSDGYAKLIYTITIFWNSKEKRM
jgi:hypothetical protein